MIEEHNKKVEALSKPEELNAKDFLNISPTVELKKAKWFNIFKRDNTIIDNGTITVKVGDSNYHPIFANQPLNS